MTNGHSTGSSAPLNAFYGASIPEFLCEQAESVVGALASRAALEFRGGEREQARAWQAEVPLLQRALGEFRHREGWSILLEYSLRRLGRRPDAIILGPGTVVVVEFKMGATAYSSQDARQAEDYALCIRDFQSAARGFVIVPLLCAENAPNTELQPLTVTDSVAVVIRANAVNLAQVLARLSEGTLLTRPVSWQEFDLGGYNPTPTIVEAARAVYAGHSVSEIGRTDADGAALALTAERLRYWVTEARDRQEHIVCLVTGTPGAGKSLLGLNLVLADGVGRVAGEPAVMLTGNRPLVRVLTGALVVDARARGVQDAGRAVHGALQTLLGYLKQHATELAPPPPEQVVVFDEAQRAWDEETGQKLLQRRRSESELFLEILRRLPWACLVCLVGPGQEINRGEGGLPLWGKAIDHETRAGRPWRVVAASPAALGEVARIELDASLHLAGGLRAYRNARFGEWVDALLAGQLSRAKSIAEDMSTPPAFLTRSLAELRRWLGVRRRGGRRPGLLASSGAVRLVADGIPSPPLSSDLDEIANWFLKSWPDFRGSDALEIPLSEFGCQGLELDYVGLCWGGDLLWSNDSSRWVPRRMSAPTWRTIRREEKAQYRLNAYRVLLTRAREGVCLYVSPGSQVDPTRSPVEFDAVAGALVSAGCRPLGIIHA